MFKPVAHVDMDFIYLLCLMQYHSFSYAPIVYIQFVMALSNRITIAGVSNEC